jgi:hypothetical protein
MPRCLVARQPIGPSSCWPFLQVSCHLGSFEFLDGRMRSRPVDDRHGLRQRQMQRGARERKLACDRYGQLDVFVAEFTDCPICLPIVNALS